MELKTNLLKKLILTLLIGSILIVSCRKDITATQKIEPCEWQTENPAGRTYSTDLVVDYTCNSKHCGMMPLSSKNYWIYEDSIFSDGILQKVQLDTLRYTSNFKTTTDEIVWWKSNISIGIPEVLYVNDSAFFGLETRLFMLNTMEAKKGFSLFPGDSIMYITGFDDAAAIGRSLKIKSPITTPAGTFGDCIYFEKNARNFRKDQVFFKQGIGVLKYIKEAAKMGERIIKPERISTLVGYHFE